ncbi:hypothetical protein LEP1GSC043_1570 [Leptospira weilii str. Ecochallenge]|uniref:Uncharacterized protein n=1 Tax=Leptospira weilii str. Ecochallenge TaxID=1049986 RepID=N1U1B0_9LEPT|nr:hypothetical protein LEP1GSC043_1570 [Leptospira weilii str. Ecochallenge]
MNKDIFGERIMETKSDPLTKNPMNWNFRLKTFPPPEPFPAQRS